MVIILMGLSIFFAGIICKYFHDDYKYHPGLFVGYKFKYAMKDRETWEEANNYIFKACTLSFIFSILFILVTSLLTLKILNIIYIIVILLVLFGPIISTEIHLRTFNKHISKNNN